MTLAKNQEVTVSFQVKVLNDVDGEVLENTANVKDTTNDFDVDTNTTTNPTPRQLKIIKNLEDFVDHGEYVEATFAFEITGRDENGNKVFFTTAGMDFGKGKTTDEVVVKGIPNKVKNLYVEESYSGNYDPDKTGQVKVEEKDGKYQISFTNTWKDDIEYKGGVTNHYVKEDDTHTIQPELQVQ